MRTPYKPGHYFHWETLDPDEGAYRLHIDGTDHIWETSLVLGDWETLEPRWQWGHYETDEGDLIYWSDTEYDSPEAARSDALDDAVHWLDDQEQS